MPRGGSGGTRGSIVDDDTSTATRGSGGSRGGIIDDDIDIPDRGGGSSGTRGGSSAGPRTVSGSTSVGGVEAAAPAGARATPTSGRSTVDRNWSVGAAETQINRFPRSSGGSADDGVSDTVNSAYDTAAGGVSSAVGGVRSGVNRVSDTLPGRTGEAFALGAGVAAIPEPTPVTEVSGAAIAGGAALVGGGILASRALRNRRGEIGIGERVTNELEPGRGRQDVSEVGVGGAAQSAPEVLPGSSGPSATEVGVGSRTGGAEVGVPDLTAAQLIGRQTTEEEEEEFTLDRESIDDVEQTSDLEEDEQMRQIREELERRQQFVREDSPTRGQPTRDPVRFPADEAATGTAVGLGEQLEPDLDAGAGSLGVGTGAGGMAGDFVGGLEDRRTQRGMGATTDPGLVSDDVLGTGTDPTSGNEYAIGIEETSIGNPADVGGETDVGTMTEVDSGTGTGTGELTATTLEESTLTGTQQVQALAQEQAAPVQDEFVQPEVTAYENIFAEPTLYENGFDDGDERRDRRGFPDFEGEGDSEPDRFGTDDDVFGSGIASVDDLFGDNSDSFRL